MYLTIAFMGILSMEDKWQAVIAAEGFSYEKYCSGFFRFILPALSPASRPAAWISRILQDSGSPWPGRQCVRRKREHNTLSPGLFSRPARISR
jgi:hypothetical protein